ncbi:CPBP family intramembrane glutamic endopeptidase [Robertkochia aurantiaca]|uniref:CPBP family intramembrane glutamic endopeptidase n=1 Tax=Robertkochia aurantiaca TaxID=2873700 RepID=UPI001CCD50DC|nr:CPBP family intramembrane glutamic endopeptidase [Robertkochia sp. 3YJGBD-33]
MTTTGLIVLFLLIFVSVWSHFRDRKKFARFKSLDSTEARQECLRKNTLEAFFLYGLAALATLILLDASSSLQRMPDFLLDLSESIRAFTVSGEGMSFWRIARIFLVAFIPLLLFAAPVLTWISVYQNHRQGVTADAEVTNQEIQHLLPRNAKEKIWVTLLSVNAGVCEELFFRLSVPILLFEVTGSTWISIIGSSIWFGLAHAYQGISGVISTTLAGLMLFYIYLLSQNIWFAVAVHIFLDLNGLIFTQELRDYLSKNKMKEIDTTG